MRHKNSRPRIFPNAHLALKHVLRVGRLSTESERIDEAIGLRTIGSRSGEEVYFAIKARLPSSQVPRHCVAEITPEIDIYTLTSTESAQIDMTEERTRQVELKRNPGLFDATAISVGAIVGAGIFAVTGITAGYAGSALVISMLIAVLISSFIALSFAELTAWLPKERAPKL